MDVKLKVHGVLADPRKNNQIAILKMDKSTSILPVSITISEGNAIRLGIEGIKPDRPMSHELVSSIIDNLKMSVEKIRLVENSNGEFSGKVYLKSKNNDKEDDEETVLDSMAGDAIAVALRANAPIYASEKVIMQSGEKNLDDWLEDISESGQNSYNA